MLIVAAQLRPSAPVSERRPAIARGALAIASAACLPLAVAACAADPTPMDPSSLEEYDAVVDDVVGALDAAGITEPGTAEHSDRGAQYEDDRCRIFARDTDAATVQAQPPAEDVIAAAAPVLEEHGFGAPEQAEVAGGHLRVAATDEQGAEIDLIWKASSIDVTIQGVADLAESECTDEAVQ